MKAKEIKITIYPGTKQYVVNTPGDHAQRQPRTYRSFDKAVARAKELGA